MEKKTLTLFELVFITVSTMIGTGLFIIPSHIINLTGSDSLFAWIIVSTISFMSSLLLAELASTFPKHGIYNFVKKAFGEFMGFLTGWIALIIAWITIAVLIGGGLHYISYFLEFSHSTLLIISTILLIGFTWINLRGVQSSVKFQIGLTGFVLIFLTIFLFFSSTSINPKNLPGSVKNIHSLLTASIIVIEPFILWEALFLSDNIKNPKVNLPKALIISIFLVSFFYIFTNTIIIGTGNTSLLQVSKSLFGKVGELVIFILMIGIILSSANSWIISSAWIPFAMAEDLLLPSTFMKLNEQEIPKNSLLLQLIVVIFIISLGTYEHLLDILVLLAIFVYILILLAYLNLRDKTRESGKFIIPGGNYLASGLIISYLILLLKANWFSIIEGLILIGLSIPFYIQIKSQTDKKFAENLKNYSSFLTRRIKGLFWAYSQEATDFLIALVKLKEKDSILDYGGNICPNMEKFAEKIHLTALCISEKELMYSKREISKITKLPNIIWVKEEEKYIPFEEENLFDVILSIGGLNYTSKPGFIIRKFYDVLKPKGELGVVIIDNLLMPAPYVINSKEEIKKEFEEYGFKEINIIIKKTLFSKYFIVNAKK